MADSTVTVEGLDECNGAIIFFEMTATPKHMRQATRKVMTDVVLPDARALCPVDEGDLEASLKVRAIPRSQQKMGKIGHAVTTSEHFHLFKGEQFYGGFVELGTEKMEADPFLRPALYGNEEPIKTEFKWGLKAAVEETGQFAKSRSRAKPAEADFSAVDDLTLTEADFDLGLSDEDEGILEGLRTAPE